MQSDASTQIDPNYRSDFSKNIVAAWGGTNDIYFGASASTAWSRYQTYLAARRAAGWKTIAFTALPRSNAGTPGDFETSRQTFNTSVRNGLGTDYDALADVAADTRIGDAGDETDTTYYSGDKVHLNTTGYGIVAGVVNTAMNSL